MITNEHLESMSKQDIETISRSALTDISTIHIKEDVSHHEKILAFLVAIKNPYCFLCKDVPVKVCFSENGPKLSQALYDYFTRIRQG